MLRDARVVAGREPVAAGAAREREQLREAEAAVAADARVRRLAARIAAHERRRRPRGGTPRAGRASRAEARADGTSRARRSPPPASSTRARRPGPSGSSHKPQRHADRARGRRGGARPRCRRRRSSRPLSARRPARRGRPAPSAFASASTASVSPPTAAASSSVRPGEVARSSPGASASTIRSPSTSRRTAAHSPSARRVSEALDHAAHGSDETGGLAAPPHESTLPIGPNYVNLANQVGAAPVARQKPRPGRRLPSCRRWFYIEARASAQGRPCRTVAPIDAKRQRIVCVPCRPSSFASACVTSNVRARARCGRGRSPASAPACRRTRRRSLRRTAAPGARRPRSSRPIATPQALFVCFARRRVRRRQRRVPLRRPVVGRALLPCEWCETASAIAIAKERDAGERRGAQRRRAPSPRAHELAEAVADEPVEVDRQRRRRVPRTRAGT